MLSFSDPTGPVPRTEPVESGRLRLEGPGHRLLQDWKLAHVRAGRVSRRARHRGRRARRARARSGDARGASEPWDEGSDAIDVTLSQLRTLLLQRHPAPPRPWDGSLDAFLAWRLDDRRRGGIRGRRRSAPRPVRDGALRLDAAAPPDRAWRLSRWSGASSGAGSAVCAAGARPRRASRVPPPPARATRGRASRSAAACCSPRSCSCRPSSRAGSW